MAHQVVWFDIPVEDMERAKQFYAAVLDTTPEMHEGDMAIAVLPHEPGDVAGCLFLSSELKPSGQGPLLYLNTDGRLDDAVARVQPNGGRVLEPAAPIAPYGHRAIIIDSEGNRIALFST